MNPAAREAMNATRTAFGADYEAKLRSEAGAAPDKLSRRKHQISSLYHTAKMKVRLEHHICAFLEVLAEFASQACHVLVLTLVHACFALPDCVASTVSPPFSASRDLLGNSMDCCVYLRARLPGMEWLGAFSWVVFVGAMTGHTGPMLRIRSDRGCGCRSWKCLTCADRA